MVTDLLLFLVYYGLTFKKKTPIIIHAYVAGTHLLCIAPYVLILLCSSRKSEMNTILPTQGQSTVSSAG